MEENWNESTSPQRPYGHYEVNQPVLVESPQEPNSKKKQQKSFARRGLEVLALAVVFGLVAGGVALGVFRLGSSKILSRLEKLEASASQTQDVTLSVASRDDSEDSVIAQTGTVAGVAQAAMPSVVAITSVSIQEIPSFFGHGGIREYSSTGSGSGIIVGENDTELLIATNNHVVDGAQTLSVCFIGNDVVGAEEETTSLASGDGDINVENAVTAKIKGTDEDNDLAVISVEKADIPEETMSQIKIAQIGSSDDLIVGEQVVAIGNALGYGQSVTSGWISALNRSVSLENGETAELIQTDAAINPGNSGGALLNMNGELIGINSAKYADETVEGMGYAIPISKAQPILEELMNRQTREIVDE
jgi:serine protease Do